MTKRFKGKFIVRLTAIGVLAVAVLAWVWREDIKPHVMERQYLKMLQSEDETERLIATSALGELQSAKAVPLLVKGLRRKGGDTGSNPTVDALVGIGQKAIPALVAALRGNDGEKVAGAAYALGRIGSPALPALESAIEDPDFRIRERVVGALKEIGHPAVPLLVKALEDKHFQIRSTAAGALGAIRPNTKQQIVVLCETLSSDRHEMVRSTAASALGWFGPKSGDMLPYLVSRLELSLNDEHEWVRGESARALGAIGPKAIETIVSLTGLLKDKKKSVREAAAWALKRIREGGVQNQFKHL